LSLAKTCSIGLRSRVQGVSRKEEELGARCADGASGDLASLTAEVVHDDHIAGLDGRDKHLLD
jgi:hypothetical protein